MALWFESEQLALISIFSVFGFACTQKQVRVHPDVRFGHNDSMLFRSFCFLAHLLSDTQPQSTLPTVFAMPRMLSSKAPSWFEKPASFAQLGKYTKGTMKPAVQVITRVHR